MCFHNDVKTYKSDTICVTLKHVFYKNFQKRLDLSYKMNTIFSKVIFLTTTKSCVPVEVQNLIGMPYLFAFLVCPLWLKYTLCHMKVPSPQRLIH